MRAASLGLLVASSLALSSMLAPALADSTPTIDVTGQGETAVAPDMAILSLSVMREAETAREALDQANAAMREIVEAMREEGVESRDLQTAGLSINPRYVYPDRGGEEGPRIVGYQVSNTLTVRVRDIERVGEVLDLSVSLGVNQGGSIVLTNDDPAAALEDARTAAVENARSKAETLAEAAGVRLGKVMSISEQMRQPEARPMGAPQMAMRAVSEDASVPIETGENTYHVNVEVSFEILQ
ncbi:MAG: SIMPL domain-containing protein [Rhizobiaceae bacterium]